MFAWFGPCVPLPSPPAVGDGDDDAQEMWLDRCRYVVAENEKRRRRAEPRIFLCAVVHGWIAGMKAIGGVVPEDDRHFRWCPELAWKAHAHNVNVRDESG